MRLDKTLFVNTFCTVTNGVNQYLYTFSPSQGQMWHEINEAAYTGSRLAVATQTPLQLQTVYDEPRKQINIYAPDTQYSILTDENLKAGSPAPNEVAWPSGAGPGNILGPPTRGGAFIKFKFVNMSLYHDLYLRSRRLTRDNMHGPLGEANVICKIPITEGLGATIQWQTPEGVYYELGSHSYRIIDFRLTDNPKNVACLRNQPISFQLTTD